MKINGHATGSDLLALNGPALGSKNQETHGVSGVFPSRLRVLDLGDELIPFFSDRQPAKMPKK